MQEEIKYVIIVGFFIILFICVSKASSWGGKKSETVNITQLQRVVTDVKRLWNLAKQDRNLLLAVLHTTSALSKLAALQLLDSSGKLTKKLDVDFEELRSSIQSLQQEKLHEINTLCPGLALDHELDWSA
jgi:hypothetical protein